MSDRSSTLTQGTTPAVIDDAAGPATPARALHLVASPSLAVGERRRIELRRPVQVGREASTPIADARLSRVHFAMYATDGGRHGLKDLASRNGTFVNGMRAEEELLRPGSVVRAGDSLFVYSALADWSHVEHCAGLVGDSAAIHRVCESIARLGPTELSVLIEGETGTGKELVARGLHEASGRKGPLVVVNVVALPEGLFESELFGHMRGAFTGATADKTGLFVAAQGGTLFLDEIGELPAPAQAKLLRALEQKAVRPVGGTRELPIDTRVIAATNARLRQAVDRGAFRADLYARLAEATIEPAPLRERPEDVPALLAHFAGAPLACSADFMEALLLHHWPFNVRELRSLVRSFGVAATAEPWRLDLLPGEMQAPVRTRATTKRTAAAQPDVLSEAELRALLVRFDGNVKTVAATLARDRTQIYRWMRRYGLDPAAFRPRAS